MASSLGSHLIVSPRAIAWPDLRARAWLWLTLIGSAIILLPTLAFGFGFDHGGIQYLAWASLQGHLPYSDIWETFFPGGVLVHMGIITVGGTSPLALRVFDWIVQIGASLLLFRLGARLAGPRAGAIAALLYIVTYARGGHYHTAQRDSFIVPLLLLAGWAIWSYLRRPHLGWLLVAGASSGLMCSIRPTYLLLVGVLALALVSPWRGEKRSIAASLRDAAMLVFLAILPLALFAGAYILAGDGLRLYEIMRYLATVYSQVERASTGSVLTSLLRFPPKFLWLGVGLAFLNPALWKRSWEFGLLLALLGSCLAIRIVESKTYLYQFWPLFACAAILAGVGWELGIVEVTRRLHLPTRLATPAMALVAVVLIAYPLLSGGQWRTYLSVGQDLRHTLADPNAYSLLIADSADQAALAQYVHEHTVPTDTIQVWGAEPGLYYATKRFSASGFPATHALLCREGRFYSECAANSVTGIQASWETQYLQGIAANRPQYIVAHYADGSLAIREGTFLVADFPNLRVVLDRDYQLETKFGIWSVFRRKADH